jgi:hypothetical protein
MGVGIVKYVFRPIRTVVSVQRKIKQQYDLGVNMFNLVDIYNLIIELFLRCGI